MIVQWVLEYLTDQNAAAQKTLLTLNSAAIVATVGVAGGLQPGGGGIGPVLLIFAVGSLASLLGLPLLAAAKRGSDAGVSAAARTADAKRRQRAASAESHSAFRARAYLAARYSALAAAIAACVGFLAFFVGVGVIIVRLW